MPELLLPDLPSRWMNEIRRWAAQRRRTPGISAFGAIPDRSGYRPVAASGPAAGFGSQESANAALTSEFIREESLDSPEAFLDRLSPRHPSWDGYPQAWAYRGHAEASWSLIPSALRQVNELFSDDGKPTGASIAWDSSWVSEMATLASFVEIADSVALPLPDHTFARAALGFLSTRIAVSANFDTTETRKFTTRRQNRIRASSALP
jgi:hypothetical protein